MSAAKYRIDIYNYSNERIAIFNAGMVSLLSYEIRLNSTTPCAFTIHADHADILRQHYIADIQRWNPRTKIWASEHAYILTHFEWYRDDDGVEYTTCGGISLEWLLQGRLIDPDDDPLAANGYSTKSGPGETLMHEYVEEQIGSGANSARQIPNWQQSTNYSRGITTGRRLHHEVLLEVLQDIAKTTEIDFAVRWKNEGPYFETGQFGRHLRKIDSATSYLLFSESRQNMLNPRVQQDYADANTTCYILYEGAEENRNIFKLSHPGATATPYARREFLYEPSEAENALDAYDLGQLELLNNRATQRMTFEVPETFRYGTDWYLGDWGTGEYRGFEANLRIVQVTINVDRNVETIKVGLDGGVSYIGQIGGASLSAVNSSTTTGRMVAKLHVSIAKDSRKTDELIRKEIAPIAQSKRRIEYGDLPDPDGLREGWEFFVTDGLKPTESTGAGTGVPTVCAFDPVSGEHKWLRASDYTEVQN